MVNAFNALTLAEQFQAGAVLIVVAFLLIFAALFCGPSLLAGCRNLFPDETVEDDEQRLVEAAQRRRNTDRIMALYYPSVAKRVGPHQADASDRRAILEAIAHMSHPSNRIH